MRLAVTLVEQGKAEALLKVGGADLATARSDVVADDLFAVAVLRKSALLVWTVHSSNQKPLRSTEWKKLAGSKIAFLNGTTADLALLNINLSSEGVPPERVEIVSVNSLEAAVGDRSINVFATMGAIKSKAIAENFRSFSKLRETPNFLGLETAEAIVLQRPAIEALEIPKSAFGSTPTLPPEAVNVIAVSELVVANKSLSEQNAAAFARALFAHRQTILREIRDIATIEKPNTEKDAGIPAHPGVAAYIDGTERTFLERYGDYFWGGVLVLSALGSFGTGLRAFLYPREQENVSSFRDRALELATKIRTSSAEDLMQIEIEIENIVRETLRKYDEGVIEEGALTALALAIEQVRSAAASRSQSKPPSVCERTASDQPLNP
ncbi:TRAP transporter substrate-binding protein [Bradyrhizobium sp. JYMT SZCCT0428]|uniref:TRAP transporter substrate-binding protein n=1 Tax=Bradyrhizobium sp. JYMT SZCCT0428 TaxID=2807673 RepID=UPI001BAC9206|nr:TRAP transporter substrate-binding protein [Bradyrhizobium sp. JYMT SZCCT0428]MBR1153850.1 TRAP transporter substrate-binding protein [Bradyrhizobium sp. JYMT SZCCT0428]